MKNIFTFIVTLFAGTAAYAQQDAAAKTLLNQVSQKYRSYDVVKTDFNMVIVNPQAGVNQTQTGTLLAKTRASKFKLTINGPNAKSAPLQEITSDGKTQWTYTPKDKEVQINDANAGTDAMNPTQIFSLYQKGYKYIYTGNQKVGKATYQAIELTPTNAQQSIFKIKLLIDKARRQIYSAQLFDKSGSRYTYIIRSLIPNPKTTDNTFTFNVKAHPGVEVNDLR